MTVRDNGFLELHRLKHFDLRAAPFHDRGDDDAGGCVVLCAATGEAMLLPTRCRISLHRQGVTTTAPTFLDLCVRYGLLEGQCPAQTATGKLTVSGLVKSYLAATEDPLAA